MFVECNMIVERNMFVERKITAWNGQQASKGGAIFCVCVHAYR